MKTIPGIVILIVLATGLGFVAGFISRSFLHNPGVADDIAEGIELNMIIGQLNRGEIEDAKRLLNLKLDTCILNIDSSLKYTTEKYRMLAIKVFQNTAAARRGFPPDESQTPKPVKEKVSSIINGSVKGDVP